MHKLCFEKKAKDDIALWKKSLTAFISYNIQFKVNTSLSHSPKGNSRIATFSSLLKTLIPVTTKRIWFIEIPRVNFS